jgi:hypothetical protein
LPASGSVTCWPALPAVEVLHRFGNPDGGFLSGPRPADQRQVASVRRQRPGDEGHRRLTSSQAQAVVASEAAAVDAVYSRNSRLQGFVEMAAAPGLAGAQVEIGRQDLRQPLIDRVAERGDHDRHRCRQRDAGQYTGGRDHGMPRRRAETRSRQPRRDRTALRQQAGHRGSDCRQQHDAAGKQQGDGQIAAHRQSGERWNGARGKAGQQRRQTEPGMAVSAEQRRLVAGLERPRR